MERIAHSIKRYGSNTFASLQIKNYRLYFIGQGISLSGNWMQTIALSWLVLKLTGSGTALGIVIALQYLPVLFLGPWGGVVADRYSKRHILFATQALSGTLALALGILVVTGYAQLWMVYLIAATVGFVNVLDNPTRQSFIHEMVGNLSINNAVTLNSMEVNLARIIGPAIAGILIATVGIGICFLLNSLTYLAVLTCLWLMDVSKLNSSKPVARTKGQLREGFSYVLHTPLLRDVLIMLGIVGTLTYEFSVSLPLLARYTFNGDASTYALLTSAMGVGAILGGLAIAGRTRTNPRSLITIAGIFGVAVLATALAPSLEWAALGMVIVGACSIALNSLGNTILQLEAAPAMRSRVMALWSVAFVGSTPIGGPVVGFIGEHLGARWGLAIGGLAALAACGYGLVTLRRYTARTEY